MAWTISNAMVRAYENSRSSQVREAESSEVTCSDGEPSAPSNTTPMPDQYYWPDKTTEHSRLSRFGMTCEPLTESHGEDLLTWFRAGFPVRILAQQEKARDLRGSAVACGVNLQGSLARYDHEACLWRTAQSSLLEDSDVYSETWPRWGMMQNGALYLLPTPELFISGSESGLWQTPVADDSVSRAKGKWNSRGEPKLSAQVMWPTPTVCGNYNRPGASATSGMGLASAVKLFPTTTGGGKSKTSCLGDWGGSGSRKKMETLIEDGEMFGPLNPEWVEWLMGWPIGATDLKPLATGKFQEWLQQHGES